ncbi:MAG: hypothetical protein A2X94_03020 [Bdellovibrionales bacterium GWB1_55_8]|nr:MAG: hypothetical protein A2X94_03020 [Bdellovibrionales bacterium GWB1_55_8]
MKNPYKLRVTLLLVACMLVSGAILTKAAMVQIASNPRLAQMARRQFQSKVLIRPRRGTVLDRHGEPLAINAEISSIAANPAKLVNKRNLARLLSKAIDLPYAKTLQRLQEKREFIWIKRHLTEAELTRLRKWHIIDTDGDLVEGLWIVRESKRVYPHKELAAHILGDVNIDLEGLEGIELRMDERLRGKVVSVSAVRDAFGRPTFIDAEAAKDVQDGEPVQLTIDASLQFAIEQELRTAVERAQARSGSVIVMDAVNGDILAMANEPSFNPNLKGTPADKRRNRTVTDGYEPGSTFKAVLLASALSKGMKLTDVIWGERGTFTVQGKRISEAESHEKFEWLSLKKLLMVSSNVASAKLALKIGADHYYDTLRAFGFGSKTDVGFPGEISGRIPPKKAWQPLTLANIGFGQGVLVTRMQMLRAYAAFANGGWLVKPRLFILPEPAKPEPPKRLLSQKVADQVTEALESVTSKDGTGGKAALEGFRVAGKTGTAQMVDPHTGAYSRSKYIASFIGFPVGTDRKVVILTSIEEPRGIYYGSETAAPLFRESLNAVAVRLGLPAEPAEIDTRRVLAAEKSSAPAVQDQLDLNQAKPIPAATAPAHLTWNSSSSEGQSVWRMPSLAGLTAREAIRVLQGHRFKLEIQGSGIVQSQEPIQGSLLSENDSVRLVLAEPQ